MSICFRWIMKVICSLCLCSLKLTQPNKHFLGWAGILFLSKQLIYFYKFCCCCCNVEQRVNNLLFIEKESIALSLYISVKALVKIFIDCKLIRNKILIEFFFFMNVCFFLFACIVMKSVLNGIQRTFGKIFCVLDFISFSQNVVFILRKEYYKHLEWYLCADEYLYKHLRVSINVEECASNKLLLFTFGTKFSVCSSGRNYALATIRRNFTNQIIIFTVFI